VIDLHFVREGYQVEDNMEEFHLVHHQSLGLVLLQQEQNKEEKWITKEILSRGSANIIKSIIYLYNP